MCMVFSRLWSAWSAWLHQAQGQLLEVALPSNEKPLSSLAPIVYYGQCIVLLLYCEVYVLQIYFEVYIMDVYCEVFFMDVLHKV